jgi:DNA-binding CsgD family transcriptional regulator
MKPHELFSITRRQAECMEGTWQGLTDKEIGERLGIAENTVTVHLQSLRLLWGIDRRVFLALKWERGIGHGYYLPSVAGENQRGKLSL